MITEALIIRKSGEYDCEVVTKLKIDKMSIQRISCLDNCIALIDLDLSFNEISRLSGIEHLTLLKRLNLSHNKIRRIDNVQDLMSLEMLDLRANLIGQIDDINNLQDLPMLTAFHLRNSDGSDTNPVCEHPAYRNIVLRALPKLQILDGGLIGLMHAADDIEKHLQSITPDTSAFEESLAALPPWLPPSEIARLPNTANSVDDVLEKYGDLKEMMESVTDILNEDSGHLLRLASSALSKAQVK